MRNFPHLKRNHRSGNWVYFRRLPLSVQAVIGRTFFERSLRTADRRGIPARWDEANREFELLVAQAVANATSCTPCESSDTKNQLLDISPVITRWDGKLADTKTLLNLDMRVIRETVQRWGQRQRFERAQRVLNDPTYHEDISRFEAECAMIGACGRAGGGLFYNPPLHSLTLSIIKEAGYNINPWHGGVYVIQKLVESELNAVLKSEERWRNYDFSDMQEIQNSSPQICDLAPNGKPFITLSQLIEIYSNATLKPKKTNSKLHLVCRYINDIAGDGISVDKINKEVLIELQKLALKIPARLTANERKQSLRKLSEHIPDGRQRLTIQAIRSWFNLLSGCFNWAVSADLMSKNPTVGIKPRVNQQQERTRSVFSSDDLKSIFDRDRYPNHTQHARYWIPLIALYSGARLNEIGQLLKRDIGLTPQPHFNITDLDDSPMIKKRLKNLASRRLIPIHPKLIELGFIDFVQSVEGDYLFDELPHGGEYEPTKAYSQWFGRYLKSCNVKSRGKVFHSFRHTFKHACRCAGVEEEIHDAITGHFNSRHVGRRYGSTVPLPILLDSISRLHFDIEHQV